VPPFPPPLFRKRAVPPVFLPGTWRLPCPVLLFFSSRGGGRCSQGPPEASVFFSFSSFLAEAEVGADRLVVSLSLPSSARGWYAMIDETKDVGLFFCVRRADTRRRLPFFPPPSRPQRRRDGSFLFSHGAGVVDFLLPSFPHPRLGSRKRLSHLLLPLRESVERVLDPPRKRDAPSSPSFCFPPARAGKIK